MDLRRPVHLRHCQLLHMHKAFIESVLRPLYVHSKFLTITIAEVVLEYSETKNGEACSLNTTSVT